MEVLHMKKTLTIGGKTRILLFIIAFLFLTGILLVSCGGGGYGGGGGGMYGGTSMGTVPGMFSLVSPIGGATAASLTPTLTWNTSAGATGYYVYLTGGTDNNTLIATVAQPMTITVSTMTPTLVSATTYTWQVKAYNAMGQTPASNGPGSFVTP
jgi:hypothetical protein